MTEEEAKAKLQGFQNDPLGFCPLIKDTCRKDCVFYVEPNMRGLGGTNDFHVFGNYCEIPTATNEA